MKNEERKDGYDLCAEHDQIWFCEYDLIPDGDDKDRLIELGWFEDVESWSLFI